jgi:hypothetical protein
LLTIGKSDNAQAPRGQGQSRPQEKTLLIRPAVQQSTGHSLDRSLWNGSLRGEIDDACNAAHTLFIPPVQKF